MLKFFASILAFLTAVSNFCWGAISGIGFGITVEPSVFECGDCYAVMWVTSGKGSGCVKYTYNDEEKTVWDSRSGAIASDDTIHVVKVPKNELIGNEYKVVSQSVTYKFGYFAIKGKTVESDTYFFGGIPKDDDIKILSISDIHELEKKMMKAVSHIDVQPDLIVLLGDIPSKMTSKKNFITILEDANMLSGGKVPVLYVRGNHETRGEFASQLADYFPTSTGELYFTFDFGALSAAVLDTGEDKSDDHREYSGLVDFESYRRQEFEWINSLDSSDLGGKYRIVFSHMPNIEDHFGMNWIKPFAELDASLFVTGHFHMVDFIDGEPPIVIGGGKIDGGDDFGVTMLTLHDGKIDIKTVNVDGDILLSETVDA